MIMATDEEIDRFVAENREFIEKMMAVQKENFEKTSELNREMTDEAIKNTKEAAEIARKKSEEFFKATVDTIASPVVQKHFITASMEFLSGLSAMVEISPLPDYIKTAASDMEKNVKQAACKNNKDCPVKSQKIEINSDKCAE